MSRSSRGAIELVGAASVLIALGGQSLAAPLVDRREILLWPGAAPGSAKVTIEEKIVERSSDPAIPDRVVTGITKPSLTAFSPAKPNGTALIVASGGGYQREVIDKEGVEVARSFVPKGVTVFLLKYRLPAEGHENGRDVPLQDGQRAVRVVRAHAAEWGVDPSACRPSCTSLPGAGTDSGSERPRACLSATGPTSRVTGWRRTAG